MFCMATRSLTLGGRIARLIGVAAAALLARGALLPDAAAAQNESAGRIAPLLSAAELVADESGALVATLAWEPGAPEADGARYFVEAAIIGDGPPRPVFAAFTEATTLAAPLPDPAARYAWRVFAVGDTLYSGGGWEPIRTQDAGPTPSLRQGSASLGLTRYAIAAFFAEEDATAALIAQRLADDLARANIYLERRELREAPQETAVRYYFAQDAAAARAVAHLLSLPEAALQLAAPTADTPPGAIEVMLATP